MLDKDVKISCGAADGSSPYEQYYKLNCDDIRDYNIMVDIDIALMRSFITEAYGAEFARYIEPTEPLTKACQGKDEN